MVCPIRPVEKIKMLTFFGASVNYHVLGFALLVFPGNDRRNRDGGIRRRPGANLWRERCKLHANLVRRSLA